MSSFGRTSKPLFSVVVPVFNRRNMIGETIASIKRQTFIDYEVIFVDDGSTDGSSEEIEKQGYRVIRQQNAGPGAARNLGVRNSAGRYIAFLDSDDSWFPWSLAVYASAISDFDSPAFLTGAHQLSDSDSQVDQFHDDASIDVECFSDYLASFEAWRWFGVSSFVIRRDMFKAIDGFLPERINAEDADLALRLGAAEGFVHISSPKMFEYRVHSGNITDDVAKTREGLDRLIMNERSGCYPGGDSRAFQRAKIISRHVRPEAIRSARTGCINYAARYYFSVLPEAIRARRIRFLVGLPTIAIAGWLRRQLRFLTPNS